jgi:hypothetical protein
MPHPTEPGDLAETGANETATALAEPQEQQGGEQTYRNLDPRDDHTVMALPGMS